MISLEVLSDIDFSGTDYLHSGRKNSIQQYGETRDCRTVLSRLGFLLINKQIKLIYVSLMQSFFNVLHCHPGVNIRRFSTMKREKKQEKQHMYYNKHIILL